jgi:hypothetical protein
MENKKLAGKNLKITTQGTTIDFESGKLIGFGLGVISSMAVVATILLILIAVN